MPRIVIALALLLSGCATVGERPAPQPRPVIVGYVPAFKGFDPIVSRADFSRYTHINLAFVNPGPQGRFVQGTDMACMEGGEDRSVSVASLRRAIAEVHQDGAKVLVSLGGGLIPKCSGDWPALLRPDRRAELVRNLVALVDKENLDGIDVDLEWDVLTAIDKEGNYTPFIAELSAAMRARGKLLTCATASNEGGMVPVSSVPYFDLVNVMSYDNIGLSWGKAGDEHASYDMAVRDLAVWRARGVPKERLVLGVPFYGYGFGSYSGSYGYRDLVTRFGAEAAEGDVIGERCPGCSYITYNSPATLARKAALAREQGAGVMVWEITQDTDEGTLVRSLEGLGGGALTMSLNDTIGPLQKDDPTPLYLQLQKRLRDAIATDAVEADAAIPTERDLAAEFDVSRITVRKAIDGLVEEGLLTRRRGAGTFVTGTRVEKSFSKLSSFSEDMLSRGRKPSSVWVSRATGAVNPEEALSLGLSPGSLVYRFHRIRYADGVPMAIEQSTIPGYCLPSASLVQDSLYEALTRSGNRPARALQRLRAIAFTAHQAEALGVNAGDAGLFIERRGFLADGRTAEFTQSHYRGDAYDFVAELSGI